MPNTSIPSAKQHLFSSVLIAGLLAMLTALLPFGIAHAASSTSGGTVPVTLTSAGSGVVGQPLAFTVTATNTTSSPADQVTLTVWFIRSTQLIAPLPNPDTCGRAGGPGGSTTFACGVGSIAPGDSVSIAFTLQPGAAGLLAVQSTVTAVVDGNSQSNGTVLHVQIAPGPTDVQVSGSASTGSPSRGANFSYTYQVKNSGAQTASAVNFADTVPAGETLLAASANNSGPCTLSGSSVSCDLGDVAPGGQVLVTVGVTAPTFAATLTNTGSAYATNGDTQPGNNSFSVTVQVR